MKDWLNLQRELYVQAREEAKQITGPLNSELKRYESRFNRDQKSFQLSSSQKFNAELSKSAFVFVGDFHPLRQSQRCFYRLLRDSRVLPKSIALEVLDPTHEKRALQLIKSKSWEELRKLLKLEEKWSTFFENYKEIFNFCVQNKIQIHGLASRKTSIAQREIEAAKRLAKLPRPAWILFGEIHCARPHLPRLLQQKCPNEKILILQQNDDREGLKRLKTVSEQKTILLQSPSSKWIAHFCLLHTPVWMKWQSFNERHSFLSEDSSQVLSSNFDLQEQLAWCLKTLYEFLVDKSYKFSTSLEELLDFDAYFSEDPAFARRLSALPKGSRRSVLNQLERSNSGVAVREKKIFLTEATLNSCAHAAASFLFRRLTAIENRDSDFFRASLCECMSFYLSKILNHSRRSRTWKDWEAATSGFRRKEAKQILRAEDFSIHFSDQSRWLSPMKTSQHQVIRELSRLLADALFEAFLIGEFSKARLSRILSTNIENPQAAFEALVEIQRVGLAFSRPDSI